MVSSISVVLDFNLRKTSLNPPTHELKHKSKYSRDAVKRPNGIWARCQGRKQRKSHSSSGIRADGGSDTTQTASDSVMYRSLLLQQFPLFDRRFRSFRPDLPSFLIYLFSSCHINVSKSLWAVIPNKSNYSIR